MIYFLTIYVRYYHGCYHGDGDEIPSPFRLFQALVAGAGISGPLDDQTRQALMWLEELDPPIIALPRMVRGQAVTMFMPNNDLDKFGGDARNIAKTRGARKVWRPHYFDALVPLIYAWPINEDDAAQAKTVCALAEKLYQLGRGVDMAWAWGEILDEAALDAILADYDGVVRQPSVGDGLQLACPDRGSLYSLEYRYQAMRFSFLREQRVFVQQPKPSYRPVSYNSPSARYVFELRSSTNSERRVAWPLEGASALVVAAREAARARLSSAMPGRSYDVDRYLVGRNADGSNAVPAGSRVRIIPIPSIGMHYADRAIRRLLVEVPSACPLRSNDIRWAFSGAELSDPDTGEVKDVLLVPTNGDDMLRHYGVGARARIFRSVTPVVLPETAKRRRIEPSRKLAEAKGAQERGLEMARGRASVVQALRHAGVNARVESIRLQREPFDGAGLRVEPFAKGTRFEKERMWHVEIAFGALVEGPLLLGDGRFLGLGLMAPARDVVTEVHVFTIDAGLADKAEPIEVARALRRAVMARVQATLGTHKPLGPFFSGHAEDGHPVRRSHSAHLTFAYEPELQLLLVLAPHIVERRLPTSGERKRLRILEEALEGFTELRAGKAGNLSLSSVRVAQIQDTILGRSRVWKTHTPYVVTRHHRLGNATEALIANVHAECNKLGLPERTIEAQNVVGVPGVGISGDVVLTFNQVVNGPLLLGRHRYFGLGLFCALNESTTTHL